MNLSDLLKLEVPKAAKRNNINGVLELASHCGLSYERTVRVYKGNTNAKLADVITVISSIGLTLTLEDAKINTNHNKEE